MSRTDNHFDFPVCLVFTHDLKAAGVGHSGEPGNCIALIDS